jgi:tetratricopeptide (TPR) repeat protein
MIPLLMLLACAWSAPQAAPAAAGEAVVARIFEHAGRLLQEGRPDLAVDEYRRLVESYPNSDLADDALLAIGSQSYGISSLDDLGRSYGTELEEAFKVFDRVRREHPDGSAAPAAILRMALLRLEPRAAGHNLNEAKALFRSVSEIYPGSEWADEARLGMALCSRRSGAPGLVVADLQPFFEALAASPLVARAQLWRADAFEALGRRSRALELYQALRERSPRAPEATPAQGRALLLLRRTLALRAEAKLAEEPAFQPSEVADLRQAPALCMSPQGWLFAADGGRGRILRFDSRGRLLEQKPAQAPALLALDASGQAALVEGTTLKLGKQSWPLGWSDGRKVAPLQPKVAPLPRPDGTWWILDERGRSVLEFDRGLVFKKTVWKDESFAASRARIGADGTAWILDASAGRLARLAPSGEAKIVSLREAPVLLRQPVDLALDPHGAAWVLDGQKQAVAIFSPGGSYEGAVPLVAAGRGLSLEAIEIDAGGGLLAWDSRQRRLRRFIEPGGSPAPAAPAAPGDATERAEVRP